MISAILYAKVLLLILAIVFTSINIPVCNVKDVSSASAAVKSVSDTTVGRRRSAESVSSRHLHAAVKPVRLPMSDSGKRLDKKAAPAAGKNKPPHAAWK